MRLRQHLLHNFTVTSVRRKSRYVAISQPCVIQTQAVQDRGLQVVNVHAVFDNVEAEVVGLPIT